MNRIILLIIIIFSSCNEGDNSTIGCDDESAQRKILRSVQSIAQAYQDSIEGEIPSIYQDSFSAFPFYDGKNIRTEVLYSKDITLIEFLSDTQQILKAECISYNPQFAWVVESDYVKKQGYNKAALINQFDQIDPKVQLKDVNYLTLRNGTFDFGHPNFFQLDDSATVILRNFTFNYGYVPFEPVLTKDNGLTIITKTERLIESNTYLSEIGAKFYRERRRQLIISSEWFRKSLYHPVLEQIAKTIYGKYDRSLKDDNYDYPYYEFELEVNKLKNKATGLGINSQYIDGLLEVERGKNSAGVLLDYYLDNDEFVLQWIRINVVIACLYIILVLIVPSNHTSILRKGFWGILPAVNGWIFYDQLPSNFSPLSAWPILVLIIAIILLIVLFPVERKAASLDKLKD